MLIFTITANQFRIRCAIKRNIGLIFDHEIDSIQNVTVAAGFTREISENANKTAYYSNAYALGLAYNFVHTTYFFC